MGLVKKGIEMRYFLDTEFIEKRDSLTLISIGIVCEDGREYYAISCEYDYFTASDWVKENVITPMFVEHKEKYPDAYIGTFHKNIGITREQIAKEILEFVVDDGETPEFWGYYSDYDWVITAWLFGAMIDLPKYFPMHCNDIQQFMHMFGIEKIPDPVEEHNALLDARWTRDMYQHALDCMYDVFHRI